MSKLFISFKYKEVSRKSGGGAKKEARFAIMYLKQNGLAMDRENISKIYLIETNIVMSFLAAKGVGGKRGEK
jgi:hypothetical protein